MKKSIQVLLALWFLAVVPSALAQGTIIFDNFRANNSYSQGAAAGLTFMLNRVAMPFTPTVTGNLISVELPLFLSSDSGNAADILVRRRDPTTGFPGTVLESFQDRGGLRPHASPDKSPMKYTSSLQPVLTAGAEYWLEVAAPEGASLLWYGALDAAPITGYLSAIDGERFHQFDPPSAFRITAAIPEPSPRNILLAATTLLALRTFRHPAKLPFSS